MEVANSFIVPVRRILQVTSMELWNRSPAYTLLTDFIQLLNKSVISTPSTHKAHTSTNLRDILTLLGKVEGMVEEVGRDEGGQRFGNMGFRRWCGLLNERSEQWCAELVGNDKAREIHVYLDVAFGDGTRLDYGSGHELSFVAFLTCLYQINYLKLEDFQAVVGMVVTRYLDVVRRLQRFYNLEPAGSHGVWGLDDFQFLPYYWGSAQLIGHEKIKPKSVTDKDLVHHLSKEYMYFGCIDYINEVKKGPFNEHSPILYSITGVAEWQKVNSGMFKMFTAEVLMKFPVVQHFLFGSLLPFEGVS